MFNVIFMFFGLIKVFYVDSNMLCTITYTADLYQLYKNIEKVVIIVWIHLIRFKKGLHKVVMKSFKYISVIKTYCIKVIKKL